MSDELTGTDKMGVGMPKLIFHGALLLEDEPQKSLAYAYFYPQNHAYETDGLGMVDSNQRADDL